MKLRTAVLSLVLLLALAACGGSDGDTAAPAVNSDTTSSDTASTNSDAPSTDTTSTDADSLSDDLVDTDEAVEDLLESSEDFADDLVDSLEDAQEAAGGGSMTLTVGDQSWTFESVLCAFGPDEIGQEGAEFVLSSIQEGKQMYVSIDSFGHSVSLNDVQDFENPSVSLSTFGGEDIIQLDGKSFSGSADFFDDTSESFETIPGTFSGTCP